MLPERLSKVEHPRPAEIDNDYFWNFIQRCWTLEQSFRPTASHAKKQMNHFLHSKTVIYAHPYTPDPLSDEEMQDAAWLLVAQ